MKKIIFTTLILLYSSTLPLLAKEATRSPFTCISGQTAKFAPLRPDPGNPCENFVPQEVKFQCGSSITPVATLEFDPYGEGCRREGKKVICERRLEFLVTLDLSKANLGILGNTQDENLTDEQKVNEYLSWYLSGVPQVGDQKTLNKDDPKDMDRLVNFSGPVRKLMPYDLGNNARDTIVDARSTGVHNYVVGKKAEVLDAQLSDFAGGVLGWINRGVFANLLQNIPFSSLEDTVGEYLISATDRTDKNMQDPDIVKGTVTVSGVR